MGGFKLGKMTLSSLFKEPETVLYPMEQKKAPAGRKGYIVLDEKVCGLCAICVKRCPAGAIEIDKKERTVSINHYRCVQCGYCVAECTKSCLTMNPGIPPVTTAIEPEVYVVPKKEKKAKAEVAEAVPAEQQVIEPTGDPDMDAKLAKLPYEKAVKLRAAFMAKQGK